MWTLKWRRIRKANLIRAADYRYRSWNCKIAFTGSAKGNFTWQYSFRYNQNHASFYFYCKDHPSASTKVCLEMTEFANLISCQSLHKWSTWSFGRGWEFLWRGDGGNHGNLMGRGYGDQVLNLFAIEMDQGKAESCLIKAVLYSHDSQSIIPSFLPASLPQKNKNPHPPKKNPKHTKKQNISSVLVIVLRQQWAN